MGERDINQQTFELLVSALERIEKKVDDGFGKLNGRQRRSETWIAWIRGVLLVVMAVMAFLGAEFITHLKQ